MSGSQGSGGHRDSYRGPDGGRGGGYRRDGGGYGPGPDEYPPYQDARRASGGGGYGSGGYVSGGQGSGGYGSSGYGSSGYGQGRYSSAGYGSADAETAEYETAGYGSGRYGPGGSGGYGSGGDEGGGYGGGYDSGGYRSEGRDSGGYGSYQRETGPYGTPTDSGRYGRDSGGYRTDSGGYRTEGGGRRPGGARSSGGYRTTGSHRVVRERRGGRLGLIAGGAAAAVVVCAVAAFAVLSGVGGGDGDDSGRVVGSGTGQRSPAADGERSAVPDSCTIVGQDVVDRLAPGSERTEADNYQSSDRQNQCVWGAYAGARKRQLTVELRAIAAANGRSATETATATFASERTADESGKSLLNGQKLTEKTRLNDVGDDGYVVYSVDDKQGSGEAIGNVRLGNVLITIHYSGSNDGDPLPRKSATDGAVEVARAVIQGLGDS